MGDILADLITQGYRPEENKEMGFEPVNGKYVCRIDSIGRVSGTSQRTGQPYDFYSCKAQVVEVVDGDKATNRFLQISYNNDGDGVKKMLNDLFTAGIEVGVKTQDELDAALAGLTDRTMNIRAWVWTPEKDREGNPIAEEDRIPRQQVRVVKTFGKAKPDKVETSERTLEKTLSRTFVPF